MNNTTPTSVRYSTQEEPYYRFLPMYSSPTPKYEPMTFTSHGRDLYFVMLGAVASGDMTLSMTSQNQSILLTNIAGRRRTTATVSTTTLLDVNPEEEFTLTHQGESSCHLKLRYQEYSLEDVSNYCGGRLMGGISLSGTMRPLVAFKTTKNLHNISGVVSFDQSSINTGRFNMATNSFKPHRGGIYYFSVSCSLLTDGLVKLTIMKNGVPIDSSYFMGKDNIPRQTLATTFIELQRGDLINVNISTVHTNQTFQCRRVSFTGFLYSPKFSPPAAWYIKTTPANITEMDNYYDVSNTSHTTTITEFLGKGVSTKANKQMRVKITRSGLYYLQLIADGSCPYRLVEVSIDGELMKNFGLLRSSYNDDFRVISSHVMLYLGSRDVIRLSDIQMDDGECKTGSLSFLGFRIYSESDYWDYITAPVHNLESLQNCVIADSQLIALTLFLNLFITSL